MTASTLATPTVEADRGRVVVVVGMQYGSEGKGHVAYLLASLTQVAVRTGAPNAGHTFHHGGRTFKMRQIPCAFVNPAALLLIGPGGLISPPVLAEEIEQAREAGFDLRGRLFVHENVGVIGAD
jgi:adenylosuccinate synthase